MNGTAIPPSTDAAGSTADPAAEPEGPTVFAVNAERLAWGIDCDSPDGDIRASYSADRIGMGKPIRRAFTFRASTWVCVRFSVGPTVTAKAYRLIPIEHFDGQATTYPDKTHDAEAARNDPLGFYHGMTVQHRGQGIVLCGPPAMFVPRVTAQLDLFKER